MGKTIQGMHEITNHIHSQYRYLHIDIAKGIGM